MARKVLILVLSFMTVASVALANPTVVVAPMTSALPTTLADAPTNHLQADRFDPIAPIRYQHGDVSWLPSLAKQAGWPDYTVERLKLIVLRESGGCPNRRGGDQVDKDCNITGVSEWNHRSDTGLLQINGVHWKPDHTQYRGLVCKQMKICTQEPLLDALTNLRAGKLLWDVAGWSPWKTPSN